MREMIDAAVAAAKREGMMGAVIVFGQGKAAEEAVPNPDNGTAGRDSYASSQRELSEAKALITGLRSELTTARNSHVADGKEQAAGDFVATEDKNERLAIQLAEAEDALEAAKAQIESLMATGNTTTTIAAVSGIPPMPTEVVSLDEVGIDCLGLDDKIVKCLKKVGGHMTTVGALRDAYTADAKKLKAAAGLTQAHMIDIGVHLAGKLPSLTAVRGQAQGPATAPGPAPAPAGALPGGFVDRPWADRYNATLSKEVKMQEVESQVEMLRAAARNTHSAALDDAGRIDLTKIPADEADAIRLAETKYNVIRGQAIAGMWHAGLAPAAGGLASALEMAGITAEHLSDMKGSDGNALVWPMVSESVGA